VDPPPIQDPTVASVTLVPIQASLTALDDTLRFDVLSRNSAGVLVSNVAYVWNSLDPSVLTVDDSGLATAKAVGTSSVVATAICCDRADTASVGISQVPDSLDALPDTLALAVGSGQQLSPKVLDHNGHPIPNPDLVWTSTDPSVAVVDQNGFVSALSPGTVELVVQAGALLDRGTLLVVQPLFQDGFETGDHSHSENGFTWGNRVRSNVKTEADGFPVYSGTYSMKLRYPANSEGKDPWAEQRFNMGGVLNEVWIEYVIRFPSDYTHAGGEWGNNNKFFVLWDPGNYPGGSEGQISYFLETRANGSGGSHLLFCHQDQDYRGGCGGALARNTAAQNFLTGGDLGTWITLRMHAKVASAEGVNDGLFEMWKNGVKIFDFSGLEWFDPDINGFQKGYIMGWANSGFPVSTHIMLDEWRIFHEDPGW
jgi:hypothetical protein